MSLKSKRQLEEYKTDLRDWYEDLKEKTGNEATLLSEIGLIWYSRYGITDESVIRWTILVLIPYRYA